MFLLFKVKSSLKLLTCYKILFFEPIIFDLAFKFYAKLKPFSVRE